MVKSAQMGKGLRQSWVAVADSYFYFASQLSDLTSLYPLIQINIIFSLSCVFLFKEIWTMVGVNALILPPQQMLGVGGGSGMLLLAVPPLLVHMHG